MGSFSAHFQFHAELNHFLPRAQRSIPLTYGFNGNPAVKDAIEAQGVPHTEVHHIVVNETAVYFTYQLQPGDRVDVYPVSVTPDVDEPVALRPEPPPDPAFVADVHLGKLAKSLRMLGFDTRYRNDLTDPEIVTIAASEQRIVLTRDLGILKTRAVIYGYYVRSAVAEEQVREVLRRYDLCTQIQPFHRCMSCNGEIVPVEKQRVLHRLAPKTRRYYDEFFICSQCQKVYWKGSHYERMQEFVADLLAQNGTAR